MKDWRTDPTFAMCRKVTDGADLASFSEGPFDVRTAVAGILSKPRQGLDFDAVPWGNFPHGHDVREAVSLLRAGGEPVMDATGVLWGLCADDSRAAVALAVPFLIPLATNAHHPHRAAALAVLSGPARARHHGVASREEFLLHRNDPRRHAPDTHDDYGYEVTGYPAGWSVAAARAAITTATTALLPLLGDSDPTVRVDAAYVLATAADPAHTIRTALANGFATEGDAMVRAALLLATAETTRTRRLSRGCANGGTTERRPPKPVCRRRSAGSASPTNPHRRSSAGPSTSSPATSAHTPWRPCRG
ncbi:hypothetical protein [Streptomyces sp. NPDC016626]|uniref:hypothetical protein n=1 Tax=Streptomyces sp. NPDC016626 TaxID=3364968 RepID=UPI0036FCD879